MKNLKENLQVKQLDKKIKAFNKIAFLTPAHGWIFVTRTTLGMSLEQLGKKMGMSAQSVKEMESRERDGVISLKVLNMAAKAFGLKLSYGFSAPSESLEQLIKRRAEAKAKQIVSRTNRTMILENQANSKSRIIKSVKELKDEIIRNKSKYLWD